MNRKLPAQDNQILVHSVSNDDLPSLYDDAVNNEGYSISNNVVNQRTLQKSVTDTTCDISETSRIIPS
jgi:hypothetical protein